MDLTYAKLIKSGKVSRHVHDDFQTKLMKARRVLAMVLEMIRRGDMTESKYSMIYPNSNYRADLRKFIRSYTRVIRFYENLIGI